MLRRFSKEQTDVPKKPVLKWTRKWWLILAIPAWVYFGYLLSQTIVIAIIQILRSIGVTFDDISPTLFNAVRAALLYGLSILIVIGVPRALKKYRISITTIGLHRLPYWRDIGMTLIALVIYIIFSAVLMYVVSLLFSGFNSNQPQNVGFNGLSTRVDFLLAFATLVIIGPFAEEVLFRGFLFGTLRKIIPLWAAILITSALFGFVHLGTTGSWNLVVDTFAMSVIACLLRVKSGSLWSSILLHMTKNGIAFYVLYILH